MNIAVLQISNNQTQYGNLSQTINKKYCELNRYTYIHNTFQKNISFLNAMSKKYDIILNNIDKYDYLAYIDIDASFNNPQKKLETLIDNQHQIFISQDSGIVGNSKFLINSALLIQNVIQQDKLSYISNFQQICQLINKKINFNILSNLGTIFCNPNGFNAGFMIIKCSKIMKQFFQKCKLHHEIFQNVKHDQDCISLMLQNQKYKNLVKILPDFTQGNMAFQQKTNFSYDEDKTFITHSYGWPDVYKLYSMQKTKSNKWWKKYFHQQNNSFLILQTQTALGDSLVITNFFKDFHQQFPDKKIYYMVYPTNNYILKQKQDIFKNNPNVTIFNNQNVDQIIKFKSENYFKASQNSDVVFNHSLYDVFEKQTGIHVQQRIFGVDFYFENNQAEQIFNKFNMILDKPICLVCSGYHPNINSIKYIGTKKLQTIIDSLKDYVTFIQVGDTGNGYIQPQLKNVINLINKTSVRDIFSFVYNSKYVLTGIHSLMHIASIKSKILKDVFVFHGCRQNISYHASYLKLDHTNYHFLGYKQKNFNSCLNDKKCCLKDITFYNNNKNLKLCDNIVKVDDQCIAKCLNDIDQYEIIDFIKNRQRKI